MTVVFETTLDLGRERLLFNLPAPIHKGWVEQFGKVKLDLEIAVRDGVVHIKPMNGKKIRKMVKARRRL